jgi:dTDP-glucose 4,6-dehydratase
MELGGTAASGRPTPSVLVTGAHGTVGSALTGELRSRGYQVTASDLGHAPDETAFAIEGDNPAPTYARCDIGSYRQLERIFQTLGPFDYVYNCAAEFGRWNGEDFYEQLWLTNVVGTKHIIRLQEQRGFRLVHFSSSEVYGDWPDLMVETVMDDHEVKQLNDYAMTKWVNEMQIRNSALLRRTESVVVRLFNTYGPGEHYSPYRSVNCRFLYCALRGIPWTVNRGHQRTSTYLTDAVRTLANITHKFKPGETYNVGGGRMHSIEELSDVVVAVTGADPGLARYARAERLTTARKAVDTSRAVRDLGHENKTSLEEGMRLTAEWMRRAYGW